MPIKESAATQLFFAPKTRAFTALWLLEELELEYQLESFDLSSERHKEADYLKLNAMGKVPVVVHKGLPVAELGAIAIYLSDLYPDKGLSPKPNAPARAAFLRWCFFSSAIMEPTLGEVLFKWEVPAGLVAWGSFAHMMSALEAGLEQGRWLLGEHFSAADVLVGSTARFGQMFGAINSSVVGAYINRITQRPAFKRAIEIEARESDRMG